MTRCALCTFLSPGSPCEICTSGFRVQRIGQEVVQAQLDALTTALALATPPAPRQRPARRKAPPSAQPDTPCGRCGVLMPWSLGRARVVARGSAVYCDDCKMPHRRETQRAYHQAHYQPVIRSKEAV